MAWEKLLLTSTARTSRPQIAMNRATTTVNKGAKLMLGPGARYEIWVDKDSMQVGFRASQDSPFSVPKATNSSKMLDTILKAMGVQPGQSFELLKSSDVQSPVAFFINLPPRQPKVAKG